MREAVLDVPTIHYAHTLKGRPEADWHLLEEHLRGTAALAERFAAGFSAGEWGRLAGLWHDLGKYSDAFQNYIRASQKKNDVHASDLSGRVDHSTAGACRAAEIPGLGMLLAYCIAGHHAGLPDNVDEASGLYNRLRKRLQPIDAAPRALLNQPPPPPPRLKPGPGAKEGAFALAFFTRMIFSCLVDADFLDTEAFVDPERADRRGSGHASCEDLLGRLNKHLETKGRNADDTTVNRRRKDVLEACRSKARLAPGFFSLNVPTGGGKTLSSLAFGLEHAVQHGLRRVVYAIPFTSIIEQTADVFREGLDDLRDEVLEHHSNLEPDDPRRQTDRSRLVAENFDSGLIVTTNVQLFESMFAARSSRCRKLHRLAKSVIILDEAQTLSPSLLEPTLAALNQLVNNYGATVVLCTATQPAVERREGFPIGLTGVRPIVDDPELLHQSLRRTTVEFLGKTTNEDIVARMRDNPRSLCIVNSRRHAAELFKALDDPNALHLSASMCAAHRSEVVAEIKRRLQKSGRKSCRVVSTQVIEAGVDVDFPAVLRASAGLDSIAQAAGRCNREGRLVGPDAIPTPGRVWIFDYDRALYRTSPLIEQAERCFREILPDHASDLLGPKAVEAFFRLHYWQKGGDAGRGWDVGADGQPVMDCFEIDREILLHAQFQAAARAYRLIDDAQTPVIVPHGETGKALIKELELLTEEVPPRLLREFDRKAQRHVVGVYTRGLTALLQNDVVWEHLGRFYLVKEVAYDAKVGLDAEAVGADSSRFMI